MGTRDCIMNGGAGGVHGKSGQQQQGWTGGADQLLGSLVSRLTMVMGVGCICSCAYVLLLLITSHPCRTYGTSSSPYCRNNPTCSFNTSSLNSELVMQIVNGTEAPRNVKSVFIESKETSLDRIVFGIAASAHLWTNRSQYVNLWWKRGKTRGFVWFDRDLGKNRRPGDPEYKVSEDTSQFKYTHKTGHRAAIRISRIVSETFRLGLPNVDWFVLGDDDTFFFTENLIQVLSKYDHTKLWYIGSNSEDHIQNQLFSYSMAYGGGGFAISYALAELLSQHQDACIHRYPWLFGSDDRMKACMSELGVPLTKEPGFHQFDVRGDVQGLLSAHPIAPVISLHHLEAIYPLFPNQTRVEALAHLMESVNPSPLNIFQQSICYDAEMRWSFSVSWGYLIHVYKGIIAPNVLEVPTLTFLSWHKRRESYAFPLNTRPRDRDICNEPSSYYMKEVENIKDGGSTRISYSRGDRLHRISVCQQKLLPMSLVKDIFVESDPLGYEWIQNPRRQCCRVKELKEESITIQMGACRHGDTLVSEVIPG